MVPNRSSEGLPSDPKYKKAGICLIEKTHVLDQLHSAVSSSAADREFNVNGSAMYMIQGIFKPKHKLNKVKY